MSLRPSVALDATDELRRIDWLDDRLRPIIDEGIKLMNQGATYANVGQRQVYFKQLAAVLTEWDKLRVK